jgi:hypothetical protein
MSLAYCVLAAPFLPNIIVNKRLDLHKLYILSSKEEGQEVILGSPHHTRQAGWCVEYVRNYKRFLTGMFRGRLV